MPFVSHMKQRNHVRKMRGQPREPPEFEIVTVKTPDCVGRKCMAIRPCTEKCRLIEARAVGERIG